MKANNEKVLLAGLTVLGSASLLVANLQSIPIPIIGTLGTLSGILLLPVAYKIAVRKK